MQSTDIWSIISVLFGLLVLLYVIRAEKIGSILGQLSFISRENNPKLFRFYKIVYVFIGIISIAFPILNKLASYL